MEKKSTAKKSKQTFEDALEKLESIARQLENGDLDLDASIREFEQGMVLAKFCHEKLNEAERKIEILQKGKDSKVKAKKVKVKPDTGEIDDNEDLQGSLL